MRIMFTRLLGAVLAVGLLSSCGSDPFGPGEERARAEAHAKWLARPFVNYSFEMQQDCQCIEEHAAALEWNRIEVVDGVIKRVVPVGGGEDIAEELFLLWPTIDEVLLRLKGPHPNRNVIDIRGEYDPTLGYPTRADFIYSGLFADATVTYYIRNVAPL